MHINQIELLNVILVLSILAVAINKPAGFLLAAFFAYGSMYFLYSAIPLISGAPLNEISAMHGTGVGSGLLVKLSTIIFLIVMFVVLVKKAKRCIWLCKKVQLYIAVVMLLVFVGYLVNLRNGDWLQLQNVVGVEGMFALALLGYIGIRSDAQVWHISRTHFAVINIVLLVSTSIAFYEVFSERAWAGTVLNSNSVSIRINRASSIFFNPNLYAYWSALVFLGCAYGTYVARKSRDLLLLGMCLASIGLYFSGARSVSLLLIVVLFLCAVSIRGTDKRLRWIPFAMMLLTFVMLYLVSRVMLAYSYGDHVGWHSVVILGERFATTPLNVLQYLLSKIAYQWVPFQLVPDQWAPDLFSVSPRVVESIEGRFVVDRSDSGFLTLFVDTGVYGLIAMLWFWGTLFILGIRRYIESHDASSVYLCAILFYCFSAGFAMRFQVFPVWLLNGVCLAFCISEILGKSSFDNLNGACMINALCNRRDENE